MRPKLYNDFETRSPLNIGTTGAYKYLYHKYTQMICVAFKIDGEKIYYEPTEEERWTNNYKLPQKVLDFIRANPDYELIAHNASFDRECFARFFRFLIPAEQVNCTQNRARYYGLPPSLEGALLSFNTDIKKDKVGNETMKKICMPRGFTPDGRPIFYTRATEEGRLMYERVGTYNLSDIDGLEFLDTNLPQLPEAEKELHTLHLNANRRGVRVDVSGAEALVTYGEEYRENGVKRLSEITNGVVQSPTQVIALKKWINERITKPVDSLDKNNTPKLLVRDDVPQEVKDAAIIRGLHSQSASSKLKTLLDRQLDEVIHEPLVYCGAHTHRFSAYGFQIHNLAKPKLGMKLEDSIRFIEVAKGGEGLQALEMLYGDFNAMVSYSIRAFVIPENDDEVLICTDLSAIEARGVNYLAEQNDVIEAYLAGKDMYKIGYASVAGVPVAAVTKPQRDVGKILELSLGYGGGVDALDGMAVSYNINIRKFVLDRFNETLPEAIKRAGIAIGTAKPGDAALAGYAALVGKPRWYMEEPMRVAADVERYKFFSGIIKAHKAGIVLGPEHFTKGQYQIFTDDLLNGLIAAWRKSRPKVVQFWDDLKNGAAACVSSGNPVRINSKIDFSMVGQFLTMGLPSGNRMYYFRPDVTPSGISYISQKNKEALIFRDKIRHGGMWAENATQSFARDLFGWQLVQIHKKYNLLPYFHVHDEGINSVKKIHAEKAARVIEQEMSIAPPWASDMPLKAEAQIRPRYWK